MRLGIYLPSVSGSPARDQARQQALTTLVAVAPELTYKDVYTKPKRDASSETVAAVQGALDTGVLYLLINDRCCLTDPRTNTQGCYQNLATTCTCAQSNCGQYGCSVNAKVKAG